MMYFEEIQLPVKEIAIKRKACFLYSPFSIR